MTTPRDWEQEFDEEFAHVAWLPSNKRHLLTFISSLLETTHEEERERVRKVVEGMMFELTTIDESIAAGMTYEEAFSTVAVRKSYLNALSNLLTALDTPLSEEPSV